MGLLSGKKALIVGVANDKSIASGITHAMHREGAEIALTYQTEKLQSRVEKLANAVGSNIVMPLDVTDEQQLQAVHDGIKQHWGHVDIVIHSVGFAPREELDGNYMDVATREGFKTAHDISAWSFIALGKTLRPLMTEGGAMLTLTYLGAVRAVPNYNVMGIAKASLEACTRYMASAMGPEGIRVNAISAGPIRTLAASGIKDFRELLDRSTQSTPLRRNVTIEEVGNTAAFLCSDMASGITGEIVYVDGGYNFVAAV